MFRGMASHWRSCFWITPQWIFLLATSSAVAADSIPSTGALNRDVIEYENRERFFRQALLLAKETKLKKEAAAKQADENFKRAEKLNLKKAITESEYRERKYLAEVRHAEAKEQAHLMKEMELDAAVSEVYRKYSAGEIKDLVAIAQYHVDRWKNVVELNQVSVQKAQSYRDWADWSYKVTQKLFASGSATQESLDQWTKEVASSQAEYDGARDRIKEAEDAVVAAQKTLERAKAEAAPSVTSNP